MKWPFVGRRYHELNVAMLETQRDAAEAQATYFRIRCERLQDAALARAGAIHEPTMVERPATTAPSITSIIAGALSMQEIDSSKRKAS